MFRIRNCSSVRILLFFASFIYFAACSASSKKYINTAHLADKAAMLAAFQWQEKNPIFSEDPSDWTNGAYYTGVARAHNATGNEAYLNAIEATGKRNEWRTWERYFHADDIAISYAYLYLNEQRPGVVDLTPTGQWIEDHLNKDHEWKENDPEKLRQILWWWCDALFMAPPVLTEYASLKDDRTYLDKTYAYYRQTYDLLWDKDRKAENGKKIFWSRGNGWILAGLALILEELPQTYEHRGFYLELYKTLAARIKKIQHEDGLWRTSLLAPESYPHEEVSGSGFYTFVLAWSINNWILDRAEYLPSVEKAWKGLRSCQQPSGKVGWVQNIGFDPQPANADSWQNFGTGAFLLAGSEVLRL